MLMHELYQRERHADFVREAEQDRRKQANKKARKAFYRPAAAKIGTVLVNVGNRLQDNVDTRPRTPRLDTHHA